MEFRIKDFSVHGINLEMPEDLEITFSIQDGFLNAKIAWKNAAAKVTEVKEAKTSNKKVFNTPEKFEELRLVYDEGREALDNVAKYFGCNRTTVRNALKEKGWLVEKGKDWLRREALQALQAEHPEKAEISDLVMSLPVVFMKAENREKLKKMHEEGAYKKDMAKEFGCSGSTISKALKKLGLSSRKRSKSEKKSDEAEEQTSQSVKADDMEDADDSIISADRRITNNLRSFMNGRTQEEKAEVVSLYEAGMSIYELARNYKATRNVIKKFLKEQGVTLRDERKEGVPRTPQLTAKEKDVLFDCFAKGYDDTEIHQRIAINEGQLIRYREIFSNRRSC